MTNCGAAGLARSRFPRRCSDAPIRASGFTLVEIVLAIFLTTFAMMGLYVIFSVTFATQTNAYQRTTQQGRAAWSVKHITQNLGNASYVPFPAPLTQGNLLTGFWNCYDALGTCVDPSLGGYRGFRYCRSGNQLNYYEALQWPGPQPLPCGTPTPNDPGPGTCPAGNFGGWTYVGGLASNSTPDASCADPLCSPGCNASFFCRPSNGIVSLHFVITGTTPTFTVNTAASIMGPQSSP